MTGSSIANCVVLVGFMGAGKTTVGRALGDQLGWRFVDLDDRIVARVGRDIPDIFRDSGEAAFREVETAALQELLAELTEPTVIAVGGGAFVQARNVLLLQQAGVPVIFLDAPPQELLRRCRASGVDRPLARDENHFRQLYEQRRGSYMAASRRVDTGGKSPEAIAAEVAATLGLCGRQGETT